MDHILKWVASLPVLASCLLALGAVAQPPGGNPPPNTIEGIEEEIIPN
ncbi:MAG: hypothetical protein F6K41_41215, partial [Symploca sp. SIO3E6]|nr:hypothetical protein [Caldora sp. SIO3E6]